MDLKYLTTFRTIVKEGSYAMAAKKLNYTQSAITFHVEQLEQELAVQLFEKIGRSMVLTKAGEQLVPYADEVLSSVEKMKSFKEDLENYQGTLRLGVAETQLAFRMAPLLGKFHQKTPSANLFLQSMNCYEIRDELLRGSLDLGIFYEDVSGFGNSLITYPMGTFEVVLVASRAVSIQHPDFKKPEQHISLSLIINEKNCIFRQMFEQYLSEKAITMDPTIELWSIPTIKSLVVSGLGVSFLPRFTVQEELEKGDLVEIPLDLKVNHISSVCAHHKNKWLSPLMKAFIELCKASEL